MEVRAAIVEDVPGILALAESFILATSYGMTFDKDGAESYLRMLIEHQDAAVFVDTELHAVAIVTIAKDWCISPVAYIEKLFVHPSARGTPVC